MVTRTVVRYRETEEKPGVPVPLRAGVVLWITLLLILPMGMLFSQSPESELYGLVGTPGFFEKLTDTYEKIENPVDALDLMQRFLPVLEEDTHRHALLLDMARIEELTGRLEKAQLHYQSAAFAPAGGRDYKALYQSMLILIDLGDFVQALLQARQIVEDSDDGELTLKTRVQQARIYQLQDRFTEAFELAGTILEENENLPAEVLYNLWVLYRSLDPELRERAEEIREEISRKYPDSPENRLVIGRAESLPTVETIMGLRDPGVTAGEAVPSEGTATSDTAEATVSTKVPELEKSRAIQTGSFRDAENAAYMQRELEQEGFTTMVVQADVGGRLYYRVLVPIAFGESEQEVLLRLKEKGFEGNSVY